MRWFGPPMPGVQTRAGCAQRRSAVRACTVQADRRWLIDLARLKCCSPFSSRVATVIAVVDEAATALFDPFYESSSRAADHTALAAYLIRKLVAARTALDNRLKQARSTTVSIRPSRSCAAALDNRLFAVQADAENLAAAARAEICRRDATRLQA